MSNRAIIVLEGPDASGKTTLARAIKAELNDMGKSSQLIHLTYRKNLTPFQFTSLSKAFSFEGVTIIDRHWISEEVYSAIYRSNESNNSTIYSRAWFEMLMTVPTLYVMCCPTPDKALDSYKSTMAKGISQLYDVDARLKCVAILYRRLLGYHEYAGVEFINKGLGHRIAQHGGLLHLKTMFPSQFEVLIHDIFESNYSRQSAFSVLTKLNELYDTRDRIMRCAKSRQALLADRKRLMKLLSPV